MGKEAAGSSAFRGRKLPNKMAAKKTPAKKTPTKMKRQLQNSRDLIETPAIPPYEEDGGRPSWDETFMNIVAELARRSHCMHHKVGCLFVDSNHRIICCGYNGPSTKYPHCDDPRVGCQKNAGKACWGLHAEDNARRYVDGRLIEALQGAILYCSLMPCTQCIKNVAAEGVVKVVYADVYNRVPKPGEQNQQTISDFEAAIWLAQQARIEVWQYDYQTKTTKRIA